MGEIDEELEKIRMKKLKELMTKFSGESASESADKNKAKGSVVKLDFTNFDDFVNSNDKVVVDFWAKWCGPCQMLSPVIAELAKEYAGKVAFAKVNVDENEVLAARFGISAIPALVFFKAGKPVDLLVGALPKSEIKRWIDRHL